MVRAHGRRTPAVSPRREWPAPRQRLSCRFRSRAAMPERSTPYLGEPPTELDPLVDWFDRFSTRLVLLDEIPLARVREAVAAMVAGITTHRAGGGPSEPSERARSSGLAALRRTLRADHEQLAASVRELGWLLGIVERDDHGGNRQALGQYGRLVCEALRRHRAEEREAALLAEGRVPGTARIRAPGQR